MITRLPCPHCKGTFSIAPEATAGKADLRLQCPACGGRFILRPYPAIEEPAYRETAETLPAALEPLPPPVEKAGERKAEALKSPGASAVAPRVPARTGGPTAVVGTVPKVAARPAGKRRASLFSRMLHLFAAAFAVVVVGAYLVATRPGTKPSPPPPSEGKGTRAEQTPPEVGSTTPQDRGEGPIAPKEQGQGIVVPLFSLEAREPCQRLASLEAEIQAKDTEAAWCEQYEPWLGYLLDEAAQAEACPIEHVFLRASDGARAETLCGRGYLFLAAYYLSKGVKEKARSFLERSKSMLSHDPWLLLLEARWAQSMEEDTQASIDILKKAIASFPDFLQAHYLLAMASLEVGAYKEAEDECVWLAQRVDENGALLDIASLLGRLSTAEPYSAQRALALLDVAKGLLRIRAARAAEVIHRQVLIEMGVALSEDQRKLAFYELGRIYEQRGNDRQAYAAYQNALRLDPAFEEARARLKALASPAPQGSGVQAQEAGAGDHGVRAAIPPP